MFEGHAHDYALSDSVDWRGLTLYGLTRDEWCAVAHYDPLYGRLISKVDRGRCRVGNAMGTMQVYERGAEGESHYYIIMEMNGRMMQIHRICFFIATGETPEFVDHRNGVKHHNWLGNLRAATALQNSWNVRRVNKHSGYMGVKPDPASGLWLVEFTNNGENIYAGHYECQHDAARAYNRVIAKLRGEFAVFNEVLF